MKKPSLSTRYQKIEWLRAHPELWDVPTMTIKNEMVKAGLCSPTTYVLDLHLEDLRRDAKQKTPMDKSLKIKARFKEFVLVQNVHGEHAIGVPQPDGSVHGFSVERPFAADELVQMLIDLADDLK